MRVRDNLSSLVSSINKPSISQTNSKEFVGKVYGVITTENTPTKELFEKYGGYNGIGTIFYFEYNQSKNNNDIKLQDCNVAIPVDSSIIDYPLVGELVILYDLPSPDSQLKNNIESQKYYSKPINLWNNSQQNSPSNISLGNSFIENSDIRNLISFQGDRIYQGRKGNGIRFGSTVKKYSNINEWSSIGKDGDPITIMVNGYITTNPNSLNPNVEEINKELSSIYMTSTQLIPLIPDRNDIVNPFTKPILPNKYFNPQIILNSDRIVLNSKKDEVMIYAKTNIELNTNNIINLNANNRIHLNSGNILLGTNPNNINSYEPVLLGLSTVNFMLNMITELSTFVSQIQGSVSSPQGTPITAINGAASSFGPKLTSMMDKLESLLSKQTFTS
jgi:hypothetical protein